MTDFQVGDRVSVEGVVVDPYTGHLTCIQFDYGDEVDVATSHVTLVERPRRKLRVGSVWECNGATRYVYLGNDRFYDGLAEPSTFPRDQLTIDTSPQVWREVPVEELEREEQ